MAMPESLVLWTPIFILLGLVFIKYAGFKEKLARGLGYFVAATAFLFLDAITGMGFWAFPSLAQAQMVLSVIWGIIAWILMLVGAFIIVSDVAKGK